MRENTEVGKGEMGAIYLRIGLNDESRLVNNSDDFRKGAADRGENRWNQNFLDFLLLNNIIIDGNWCFISMPERAERVLGD